MRMQEWPDPDPPRFEGYPIVFVGVVAALGAAAFLWPDAAAKVMRVAAALVSIAVVLAVAAVDAVVSGDKFVGVVAAVVGVGLLLYMCVLQQRSSKQKEEAREHAQQALIDKLASIADQIERRQRRVGRRVRRIDRRLRDIENRLIDRDLRLILAPTPRVMIDRNVWQYLVDATAPAYDPARDPPDLRDERVAAVRIALYPHEPPWITPSVHMEFDRIKDVYVQRDNAGIRDVLLPEIQPANLDLMYVAARTLALRAHHPDEDDCRAVAEAEAAYAKCFISNDTLLRNHLASFVTLVIMKPSEYWLTLDIPRGAEPAREPLPPNPLASQSWWRW